MMNISLIKVTAFLAIDTDKYIDIYKEYKEYFSNFSVINDILRSLGWFILKGLLSFTSMLGTLLDKVFEFINFLDSDKLIQFFNTIKPFIWTVLLFALIYLAYCYIFAHKKPEGVISNILIFAGTVVCLPYMMSQMNQIVTYGKEVLSSDMGGSSYELLIPYITDLVYLDSIDFDSKKINGGICNGFTEKNYEYIQYIDVNEVVDPGDFDLVNEKLFKQHVFIQMKKGVPNLKVLGIKKGKFYFPGTVPYYYRYHINFVIAALYLLSLVLVMAFSSIKLIHLIYELAAEKIMAPFIAAGDLTGGQKIRKALIGILNGYITILCVLFLQKLFILATELVNTNTWSDNVTANGLIKAVMILAGALFVIDGPNFFEQIFGVDAGLKSVGQALQSAYYASQMLGGLKRSIGGAANKFGKTVVGGTAGIAGALGGLKDTGAFDTNNEKVSQDMAMNFGQPSIDPSHALGQGSEDIGNGYSELPGERQWGLPGESSDSTAFSRQKSGNQSGSGSSQERDSGIPEGDGKQNLAGSPAGKGTEQNADVNNAINDALNNVSSDSASESSDGSDVKDNDNLSSWAMRNTRAGRYLRDSYEKGKSLGRATGNTINNKNRKKENKPSNIPKPPDQMDKDNLKK